MNLPISVRYKTIKLDLYKAIGLTIGLLMPLISAMLYPTYVHAMHSSWVEWTRLTELPFVVCELVFIYVALHLGYRDAAVWHRLPKDIRWALGLLFVGLTVSSVMVSKNPAGSIVLSLITLIHLRFGAAIFFLARSEKRTSLHLFIPLLAMGLLVLAGLTAWKFALPPQASSVPGGKIEWVSALPGFINVRHFGSWTGAIAAGLMMSLLYGEESKTRSTRFLYLLAAGMTFWSGTRAAVLAMAVVALIGLLTLRRLPKARAIGHVLCLTAIALIVAILLAPPGQPDFLLYVSGDMKNVDTLATGRLELWRATFFRWLDAPVFGWGSGSTFWEVDVGWSHTQPHNAILQFLISWGVVGATGGLWLIGRAIVAVHHRGMTDDRLRPLTATLYSLLFMSLLEGMLHYPRFIMVVMIGFAVILADQERETPEPAERSKHVGHPVLPSA